MAWRIGRLPKETSVIGKIARITPSVIYLNLGDASGFESGQELTVYREGEEVLDPDTKEVLTKERHKLAKIRVVEVARTYSKARMVGDLEVPLKIGDEVESSPEKLLIAVLPVEDDSENEAGRANRAVDDVADEQGNPRR